MLGSWLLAGAIAAMAGTGWSRGARSGLGANWQGFEVIPPTVVHDPAEALVRCRIASTW